MKYICKSCGEVVDEDELNTVRCKVSDYAGGSYQTFTECTCGGDYEEAKQCAECGEYFAEDEMSGEYCTECLKEHATVENAIESGNEATEKVSVNGFVAFVFSEEEINEILVGALEKKIDSGTAGANAIIDKARDFCFDDATWFAEWLEEKRRDEK